MFRSIPKQPFVVVACLLCGAFASPMAFAGPMPPGVSQIDGFYATNTLEDQTPGPVVSFSLSGGEITSPSSPPSVDMTGLTVPDLDVTINFGTVTVTDSSNNPNFTLSVTPTESIVYAISNPAAMPSSNMLSAEMTLTSNTTSFNLSSLSPALLSLNFPTGVNFDPSWPTGPGAIGKIYFQITPLPEPASIAHLTWVGALGVVSIWRRRRRTSVGDA